MDFTKYMLDFYGVDSEIYPEMAFNRFQIEIATKVYISRLEKRDMEFVGDSVDREAVRDIILEARAGVIPEFAKI